MTSLILIIFSHCGVYMLKLDIHFQIFGDTEQILLVPMVMIQALG